MSVGYENIAFTVLIGGKSSRFGSDKGIFEFSGKPFLAHQLDILYKFNKPIFIIAHSNEQLKIYKQKIYFHDNVRFLLDNYNLIDDKHIRTPMIGLYTAFKELTGLGYEKAFAFSCDAPFIKYDVVELLLGQPTGYDSYIPRWNNGFLEPLFSIYPVKDGLKRSEKCIKKKEFKLVNLLGKNWKIKYISIEGLIKPLDNNLISFINVNGPIDIEKLVKYFSN